MMFDAIVVGARFAGAPTAILLARKGYRVLLVDMSTFPSDQVLYGNLLAIVAADAETDRPPVVPHGPAVP
jgi:flavin-dependent dehydrogenase